MSNPEERTQVNARLRQLPSVQRLLARPEIVAATGNLPERLLADSARHTLAETRRRILADASGATVSGEADLAADVVREAQRRASSTLRRAVNATGIVLHTGLGRARLANAAQAAIAEVAGGHAVLEIDTETGKRGARQDHVRGLLRELTGAEDATVVNNCAGAVFLAVTTLAAGREVILSRGELVEIGGAFRMPDIVRSSGAALVEVGTTNRTRLSDYAAAITERTGLILRCHPSNFALVGFTEETPTGDLVKLGREHGIPVMDDQGSGALVPPRMLGLPETKGSLGESVAAGCDIVTASGDKLLGGPQSGLLLGRRDLIERIMRHPLARALRVDKLTLAALEATLRLYRDPERAVREIPTLRYMTRTVSELQRMAEDLIQQLEKAAKGAFVFTLQAEHSQVGGGSLPGEDLSTLCVSMRSRTGTLSPDVIAAHLRSHSPPIFARIKADHVLFDPRTLEPEEIADIANAVRAMPSA